MNRETLAPLTGVLFIIMAIVGFAIQGEPKSADDPVNEIVDFYVDNKDSIMIGSFIAALASVLLVYFAAHLRTVLDAAEGVGGMLSVLPLVGASIMAIGIAIDQTVLLALAESAEDIEPSSVQTLQALWDNDFIPIAMGTLVFLSSLGLAIVRSGVLPKWLGWVAIVLAVVGMTPAGFAAFIGSALLIVVTSVILTLRAREQAPQAA